MAADDSPLARLLRRHRIEADLTQEALAEQAGISTRTVSDVERGLRTSIYRDTAERLASTLGLEGDARTEFEAVARGRPRPRVRADIERPWAGARLPFQPTSLLGREDDVRVVRGALTDPDARLVTITGTGGIGKTRVAIAAGGASAGAFADGVAFVSLAGTRDPRAVPSVVAHRLGMPATTDDPVGELAGRLAGARLLVVLDTFEHVLEAAPSVGDLVGRCEGLSVLTTSREALRLSGEREVPLSPLPLPEAEAADPVQELRRSPAGSLFLERATAVAPSLTLDADAARIATEVCRRLSGLPLAIELAAARVRHLPLTALRDEIGHGLALLSGGPRDLPPRQQTMRDTVAWSYELLDQREAAAFRALSVFAGGWALAAAEAVVGDTTAGDTLRNVSALVDKSLVAPVAGADEPRYSMLDVIREYATELRDERGETETLRRRHAEHFAAFAERAEPGFAGADQHVWYRRVDLDHDNVRAALRWSIETGAADVALRIAINVWQFWRENGDLAEGRRWFREILAMGGGTPRARAKAMWAAAWLAWHQDDVDEVERLSEELDALAGNDPDPIERRNALTVVGIAAMGQGRYADALPPLQEGVELLRPLGDTWYLGTSLLNLATATMHAGDPHGADAMLEEAGSIYSEVGDRHFVARCTGYLGHAALLRGDVERAGERFADSLTAFVEFGDRGGIAEGLEGMSAVAAGGGDPIRAARIAGAADALRATYAGSPYPHDRAAVEPYLARARGDVEEGAWTAAWAEGREMPVDEAIQLALATPPGGDGSLRRGRATARRTSRSSPGPRG